MNNINIDGIYSACNIIANRCTEIPVGHFHGASWLYNQAMRAFDSDPAIAGITLEVNINLVGRGYATINRDGTYILSRYENGQL